MFLLTDSLTIRLTLKELSITCLSLQNQNCKILTDL